MGDIVQSGQTRVWVFEGGAGPGTVPIFWGWAKINDPSWGQGDATPIKVPSTTQYNKFVEVDSVQGESERPTLGITAQYLTKLSDLMRLTRKGCENDIQAHIGKCTNPQDFNRGWEKIVVFPKSRITTYSIENFGALSEDERNPTKDTGEMSAAEMYEIARLQFSEILGASAVREITASVVCDTSSCGDCGDESDGCQKVFFGMSGAAATPGTKPAVIYSKDAGATGGISSVTTLFSNEFIDDMACIGGNLVLASNLGGLHFADISDLLSGLGVWTEIATGFVVGKLPNAIAVADVSHVWLAAEDGYIYFSNDIISGVTVQDAGVTTIQDLNAIDAFDTMNVVAVGDSNAVVFTTTGGESWQAVTGPAIGITLTCVYMHTATKWIVTTATAAYRTDDSGATWTQITLPVTPIDISKIRFSNSTVGYMAVTVAGPLGKILRTIDGGHSWYVLPEQGAGVIAANEAINTVAACVDDVNVVFGGGLEATTVGVIVKAKGS
jgi:hypothetical protein